MAPAATEASERAPQAVQCSRCRLVIVGDDAGERLDHRDKCAEQTICYTCWRQLTALLLARYPGADAEGNVAPYNHAGRHIEHGPILVPAAAMRDYRLATGAMPLYAELYQRGAAQTWIAATQEELAESIGYHPNSVETALRRLRTTGYLQVRRGTRPAAYRLADVAEEVA